MKNWSAVHWDIYSPLAVHWVSIEKDINSRYHQENRSTNAKIVSLTFFAKHFPAFPHPHPAHTILPNLKSYKKFVPPSFRERW